MQPAAPPVVRSAIAGRPAPGCSVLKARATGPTSGAAMSACSIRRSATSSRIDAFGLFTGQVGWAANNVLFYVKGGAAVTADRFRIRDVGTGLVVATTGDDTRWGGVVGAGLEFGFAPNWSAGIEYNHLFMQDRTHAFVDTTGASSAPTASARTSISSPFASTIAGVARSSRSTDRNSSARNTERPASRRPFCLAAGRAIRSSLDGKRSKARSSIRSRLNRNYGKSRLSFRDKPAPAAFASRTLLPRMWFPGDSNAR